MPKMVDRKRLLITGATGYIGRRLIERLLAADRYNVRVLVRNRNKLQSALLDQVEVAEGSTFAEKQLDAAVAGIDTAYYLIHSMGSGGDYAELDRRSAELFREACIRAGVQRIVYLGGLGEAHDASEHLLSRMETGEILSAKPDGIQTIWFRAGVIIGSGSASFEIIRNITQKVPLLITPRWVRTRTQAIGIDDVLRYLEAAAELIYPENLVVDVGSEPLSFQNMMLQAADAMGLRRFIVPVPVLSPRLSSYWLILFTPVPYALAAALVDGLKSETIVRNDNASRFFPEISVTPFRRTIELAMAELASNQVLSRWCDSSSKKYCDIKDFDSPSGAILRDVRIVAYNDGQTAEDVFRAACAVGGVSGWFKYNYLWRLRGLIDKLAGGYGLNRGRRNSAELRVGDALDFWKVVDIKEDKRLLLYAQMKLPGQAWLEFDIQPDQLVQTAHFLPRGILGRLYWYSVLPFHAFVFPDLAKTIVRNGIRKAGNAQPPTDS